MMAMYISCFITMLLFFCSAPYTTQGRPVLNLANISKEKEEGNNKLKAKSSLIGSRPPICGRRCVSCGHCEPVQMPVVPPKFGHLSDSSINSIKGYDKYSNYKPMYWRCKCGERIFNP